MSFGKETTIHVVEDPLKKIRFWLDALNNPNIDAESKKHLNDCLRLELVAYKNPVIIMKYPVSEGE